MSVIEVPAPEGDLGEIEHAVKLLDRWGRDIERSSADLDTLGDRLGGTWEGGAAAQYDVTRRLASTAVLSIGEAQCSAARSLEQYAREYEQAQEISREQTTEVRDASARYVSGGRSALGAVSSALDLFFDNPLADVLGHVVPVIDDIQARIANWNPQIEVVELVTTGADVVVGSAEAVGAAVASGFDAAISTILDGIEAVAGFVGGAIDAALDLVNRVQRAFELAVGEAIRMAQSAVKRLYDKGVEVATTLGVLVTDIARSAWECTVSMVQATTDFLVEIGMETLAAINEARQASEAAIALLVLLGGTFNPLTPLSERGQRRIDPDADDDALVRFTEDGAFARNARDMNLLAGAAYDESGAPPGWTRIKDLVGPEGGAATLFVGPDGRQVLAFRGTQPDQFDDIAQDLQNAGNLPSEQHQWAIRVAREAGDRAAAEGRTLDLTGHSLGGSLASTASIATGQTATTFNAAGVGDGNHALALLAGGAGRSETQITNFVTPNDPLTFGQDVGAVDAAAGAFVTIASNTPGRFDGHGWKSFDWKAAGVPD